MAIKFILDSASDISAEEAEKLGVSIVPLTVQFKNEEYLDGVNLLPKEFYEKLIKSSDLPKTSQANPYQFEEVFENELKVADQIIVITISSKLSGTYTSAVSASEKFGGRVFVLDSQSASLGERHLCLYGLTLEKQGLRAQEIVDKLNEVKSKIQIMAMVNTLKYLKKGGRISSAVAFAGELFAIKPVVGVVDGEIKMLGKAMGAKKGHKLLNSIIEQKGIDLNMPHGLIWAGTSDEQLQKYIADSTGFWKENKLNAYMIGSTIGTHVGPGTIGVAYFQK